MKRLTFKLTLLTDVVVHADSATEGERKALDFIPGSNFLGLVAQRYDEVDRPYDVFHSDKVRFGDAHPALNNIRAIKAPLSWFVKKGEKIESERWVHHAMKDSFYSELIARGIQLQQVRHGWIIPEKQNEGNLLSLNTNFAIKSAYDRQKRRSADSKMYGFKSLESGSEWIFHVDMDDDIDDSFIQNSLTGIKYIGKSRSAQYGKVQIEPLNVQQPELSSTELFEGKYLVVYAESRLAFFDEYGQPTLRPEARHFNLDDNWNLDWSKSQVMYSVYAPYNFKNRTFLNDRICFDKGSVFVFEAKDSAQFTMKAFEKGVGAFLNEGFGQVLVNPVFLAADPENARSVYRIKSEGKNGQTDKSHEKLTAVKDSDPEYENKLSAWLQRKIKEYKEEEFISQRVLDFIKKNKSKFSGITPSQWGQIRAVAMTAKDYDEMMDWLFKDVTPTAGDNQIRSQDRAVAGLLMHGKSEKNWKKCRHILRQELEDVHQQNKPSLQYAAVLATQMQKEAQK